MLAGSVALLLCACDTNPSVTDPDRPMVIFQGQLTNDGSNEHELRPNESGAARFEVSELVAEGEGDDPENATTLFLDVGLGRPGEDDACGLTFETTLRQGGTFIIDLSTTTYCVVLSDDGLLPEDTTVDYTLVVSLPD